MGNLVAILTDVYFPHPMAGGICAHQLAKGFLRKGFEVHVVCYFRKGEKKEEIIEGIHIHRLKMPLPNIIRDCSERIKNSSLSRLVYKIAILINRISKIIFLKWFPLKSPLLIRRYVSCVRKLNVDIVIGEFYSIESAYAACILKQKYDISCVIYSVDSLSNCDPAVGLSLSFVRKKGLEWEKRLFSTADCIAVMKCHENHYKNELFDEYRSKIGIVDLPLMEMPNYLIETTDKKIYKQNDKKITWIYTGSLSRSIRNPDYLLKVLEKIKINIKMDFYSKGDCEQDINRVKTNQNVTILQHGHIPKNELEQKYRDSDFLISIGNFSGDFLPSKTIEYIAHCKPIIHFCYQNRDASLPYLNKYGHALIIKTNEGTVEEHARIIELFIKKYIENNIMIDPQFVIDLFYENTPIYSVDIITKMLHYKK